MNFGRTLFISIAKECLGELKRQLISQRQNQHCKGIYDGGLGLLESSKIPEIKFLPDEQNKTKTTKNSF